jgi:hypothetical protein
VHHFGFTVLIQNIVLELAVQHSYFMGHIRAYQDSKVVKIKSRNSKYRKLSSGSVATADHLYRNFSVIHSKDKKTSNVRLSLQSLPVTTYT